MAGHEVELRHLRAYVAVATHHSFTVASRELLLTQPALTRTIQQLERALGVRLLERSSRAVAVTDAGEDFLVRARRILGELDSAVASARGERALRVGFAWVPPNPWTREAIGRFESTTGADVQLLRRDDLASALADRSIDVALLRTPLDLPDLVQVTVAEEGRLAAVASGSPLAERATLTWAELADHPVVVNTLSGTVTADLWPAEHRPSTLVASTNWDEWIEAVAAGRGVGATPVSAARQAVDPGITLIPLVDAPPVAVGLGWLRSQAGPLVRQFVDAAFSIPFAAGGLGGD